MPKSTTTRRKRLSTIPAKFQVGFLSHLDGRTELSKALRANYEAILADVGGASEVSHIKASLIERFCWLEATLQTIEQDLATGAVDKAEAIGKWIHAVNALSGLAKVLGTERKFATNVWSALEAKPQ